MAVVAFNYTTWATRFPELAGSVASPLATLYFNEACLYCDNTDSSPIVDVTQRAILLNLVTAHVAQLNAIISGVAPSPLVGRITQAAQGSVNVSVEMAPAKGALEAWFNQTRYGAQYWAMTARLRRGFYVPGNPRFTQP